MNPVVTEPFAPASNWLGRAQLVFFALAQPCAFAAAGRAA